jgi:membrane protein required for colicin V production
VKLFENALNRLIERVHLESLDRALGLFLGVAEGIFVVFMLVLLLQLQPFFDPDELLEQSTIARFMLPLLPYAERMIRVAA